MTGEQPVCFTNTGLAGGRWLHAGALGLMVCAAGMASAQGVDRGQAKDQLRADQARLIEAERRSRELEVSVSQLARQREELNSRLIDMGREIQSVEGRMTSIEKRLGKLNAQKDAAQRRLQTSYVSISKLLAAMQRMGRNPPPVIVTQRKDALEMVRSAMLMARAFPHLRGRAQQLGKELLELETLIAGIRTKRDELSRETRKLATAQSELKSLLAVKKKTVGERQQQLAAMRRSTAEISRNVRTLSELIGRLDAEVAAKTGLGAYEKRDKSKETKVAAAPPPRPPGAVEYKPKGSVFKAMPGRLKPAIAFRKAKAMLPLPAAGRRVVRFGERTELGSRSKGIVLETRHGAQITSPCDGWIVYAGVFRSYGQLLIINAGDGYHVLLAGLSTIDVRVGQFVLASEPVGTMAVKRKGKSQDNAPVLYVEFRKGGRPINPDPWWLKG